MLAIVTLIVMGLVVAGLALLGTWHARHEAEIE